MTRVLPSRAATVWVVRPSAVYSSQAGPRGNLGVGEVWRMAAWRGAYLDLVFLKLVRVSMQTSPSSTLISCSG